MMAANPFSSAVSGVLYAEDFDEPPPARVASPPSAKAMPEPQVTVPSFSLEELRSAVEQAFREGSEAERSACAHAAAEARNDALVSIGEQLRIAQENSVVLVEQGLNGIAGAAVSLLSAALPGLCARRAETDVRALLRRMLPAANQFSELQIRLHPSLRSVIEEDIAAVLEGSGTQVVWTESAKTKRGDVAVIWQGGMAMRDTTAICAEIRDAVVALLDDKRGRDDQEACDEQ